MNVHVNIEYSSVFSLTNILLLCGFAIILCEHDIPLSILYIILFLDYKEPSHIISYQN